MKTVTLRAWGLLATLAILGLTWTATRDAHAFCGFFVAKADTNLYNKASKVVMVRDGDRTVLTMVNDYKGDPKEFAMVVPVPTFLEKDQIHVGDQKVIDHLDAFTSPRLVEYFDSDPCTPMVAFDMAPMANGAGGGSVRSKSAREERAKTLGVTIEAEYTVGEYDILILDAKQSKGLETFLIEEGYKIPKGASKVIESYLKQKMRFFVAKVNLEEQTKLGFSNLRPLQMAYESPKFMLPIRLGMVNADGAQEIFVFAITKKGRVETTNYRTVKLPSDIDVPVYVKDEFSDFYTSMFTHQVKEHNQKAVFVEYGWDMSWCDPCAADPLTTDELRTAGVFWAGQNPTYVTRLHVRYDDDHFPEDLQLQVTSDRTNFQGRYILRHPWQGDPDQCDAAQSYFERLYARQQQEAENLADLTGWAVADIRKKMKLGDGPQTGGKKWWEKLWE